MTAPRLGAIVVVVPIRNEIELLGSCLTSLQIAESRFDADGHDLPVSVVLVADSCTDGSEELARASGFSVIAVQAGAVGAARAAGVTAALATFRNFPLDRIWVASTDADSEVPAHWLNHHHDAAEAGLDVLVGTVRPREGDLSAEQMQRWAARRIPGQPNGHVHGANLGIRANVLAGLGGFPAVREHEDVHVVAAAIHARARVGASDHAEVVTSGRMIGRTPGGYARHLRETYANFDSVRASVF